MFCLVIFPFYYSGDGETIDFLSLSLFHYTQLVFDLI